MVKKREWKGRTGGGKGFTWGTEGFQTTGRIDGGRQRINSWELGGRASLRWLVCLGAMEREKKARSSLGPGDGGKGRGKEVEVPFKKQGKKESNCGHSAGKKDEPKKG